MSSGIQYPSTVIVPNSGGGIPLRNVNKGHVTTSTFAISTEVGVDVEVVRSTDGDSETKDNGSWKRDYGTDAVWSCTTVTPLAVHFPFNVLCPGGLYVFWVSIIAHRGV